MKDPLLTQLRQQLKKEAATAPTTAPSRPAATPLPMPEEDEATLFARATAGARRLITDAVPPARQRPDPNARLRRAAAVAEREEHGPLSDAAALVHDTTPEAQLAWARNGVQARQVQKLQQGKLPWQAAVDLHGCTVDQAREAVLQLIAEARRQQHNVVKVVHGKGHARGDALLKTFVNGWLRQLPDVLAFVSAQPRDGGTGAVYVLLTRQPAPSRQ